MVRLLIIVFCWMGSAGIGNETGDFRKWKSRPKERFTQPIKNFEKAKKILMANYLNQKISEERLYYAALQGMLENLDPKMKQWNRLLTPMEYQEMKNDLKNEIVGLGIGLKFNQHTGMATVLNIIPRSPASQSKILPGDQILKVNGTSYKGKQLRDLIYSIRGKVGTSVTLTLLREDKILKKEISRSKIVWDSVTHEVLPHQIGLITIRSFSNTTSKMMKSALASLKRQKITGLIIDLRTNQGGLFKAVRESSDQLLEKGAIIARYQSREGKEKKYLSQSHGAFKDLPMTVLISGETFSGAECFAASMKESRNATLVGEKTKGKWSIQTIVDLPNGFAMRYTVAMFKSPLGNSYNDMGLPPDVQVKTTDNLESICEMAIEQRLRLDPQLRAAVTILKQKIEG